MPKAKSKSKSQSKSKDPPPVDGLCNKCEIWGKEGKIYGCEICRNGYHEDCIDEIFRNKNWNTCKDLGETCDFKDDPPFQFDFGEEIDRVLQNQKKTKRKMKKTKSSKTKKRGRRYSNYGYKKKERIFYDSCIYWDLYQQQHVTYKIGENILTETENGYEVARITAIIKDDDEKEAQLKMLWFWKANQVHQNNDDDNGELYLDGEWEDTNNWATVQGKAIVFGSKEEYLKHMSSNKNNNNKENVFWCTHSYNNQTKKKLLLPSHVIPSRVTKNITPAITKKTRKRDRRQIFIDDLEEANKSLMLSSVPLTLPCREREHDEIEKFMKKAIKNQGIGSGLYISGMPGTGKTATVRQIARELQKLTKGRSKHRLPPFDFREINAMKLPTPHHIYTELCKYLFDKHYAPATAAKKLEKYFSTKDKNRKLCVLLVDELDYFLTRKQKVVYNIFDWPTRSDSKLVIIGIANTMDLPERLLPRVSSRMGVTRIVFKPYSREQLIEIVQHRLEQTKVFDDHAIKFCASSVASLTGDCRVVLQICRRAIDIVLKSLHENKSITSINGNNNHNNKRPRTRNVSKNNKQITSNQEEEYLISLHHIKVAKAAFDQSNDVQIVSTLSIFEKLFLMAMVMYNVNHDGIAGTIDKYRQKFDSLVQTRLGEQKMQNVHFRNMLDRLEDIGLITITFNKKEWIEWIRLNVNIDDTTHALKENSVCAKIISSLQL